MFDNEMDLSAKSQSISWSIVLSLTSFESWISKQINLNELELSMKKLRYSMNEQSHVVWTN